MHPPQRAHLVLGLNAPVYENVLGKSVSFRIEELVESLGVLLTLLGLDKDAGDDARENANNVDSMPTRYLGAVQNNTLPRIASPNVSL